MNDEYVATFSAFGDDGERDAAVYNCVMYVCVRFITVTAASG